MLPNLYALVRIFCFWLIFFVIERSVFLICFSKKIANTTAAEIVKSYWYGLRLDASTAAYISMLPLLLYIAWWNISSLNLSGKIFRIYFRTVVVVCAMITVINFNIYREWGAKVNNRAFEFLIASPGEAIASSISSPLLLSLVVLALLIASGFAMSNKLKHYQISKQGYWPVKLIVSVGLLGLNFLLIRGGWQLAPINESMAYYSDKPVLNHAAVTTEWSLLHSLKNVSDQKNPYVFTDNQHVKHILNQLYPSLPQNPVKLLTTNSPNIILVIMESFTADVVESLGGEKGVAPLTEKLISQGLLFNHIYSSGDRTDRGVVAILSGFPTQGLRSIVKESNKSAKLPSLFESLQAQRYYTSFYYGGESEFANMKSYLLNNGCNNLVDKTSFDKKDMNSKWGAYDDVVYKRVLQQSSKNKSPFFTTVLTLTNHEPFELPVPSHFKGEEIENKFRSTAYFADSCLGAFIQEAKKHSWYKNTLFIVVADHGHRLPKQQAEIYHPNRYRIPLFFFGEVIKPEFRGKRIEKIGSQTDIAATLFTQLNVSSKNFLWSKDLLNPYTNGHAFYSWDNGFGLVDSTNHALSFDNVSRKVIYQTPNNLKADNEWLLAHAKGYMQGVFQQYLAY